MLGQSREVDDAPTLIEDWRKSRQVALDRFAQMLADQRASGATGASALSMLSVAVKEIGLLERA
ncbi:hypothetical protein D3C72_2375470 [compost metagenome]